MANGRAACATTRVLSAAWSARTAPKRSSTLTGNVVPATRCAINHVRAFIRRGKRFVQFASVRMGRRRRSIMVLISRSPVPRRYIRKSGCQTRTSDNDKIYVFEHSPIAPMTSASTTITILTFNNEPHLRTSGSTVFAGSVVVELCTHTTRIPNDEQNVRTDIGCVDRVWPHVTIMSCDNV